MAESEAEIIKRAEHFDYSAIIQPEEMSGIGLLPDEDMDLPLLVDDKIFSLVSAQDSSTDIEEQNAESVASIQEKQVRAGDIIMEKKTSKTTSKTTARGTSTKNRTPTPFPSDTKKKKKDGNAAERSSLDEESANGSQSRTDDSDRQTRDTTKRDDLSEDSPARSMRSGSRSSSLWPVLSELPAFKSPTSDSSPLRVAKPTDKPPRTYSGNTKRMATPKKNPKKQTLRKRKDRDDELLNTTGEVNKVQKVDKPTAKSTPSRKSRKSTAQEESPSKSKSEPRKRIQPNRRSRQIKSFDKNSDNSCISSKNSTSSEIDATDYLGLTNPFEPLNKSILRDLVAQLSQVVNRLNNLCSRFEQQLCEEAYEFEE